MRNIKITLEYDGTNYRGWQIQRNTERTVQQVLEDSLSEINKAKVKVVGAGRTDAGVHALNQVANFKLDVPIPVERIPMALNSVLPEDIICKDAEQVPEDFHAQYDAKGKKYRYRILNRRYNSVFVRNYVWNLRQTLDFKKIRKGAKFFQGRHDFEAFMDSGSDMEDTLRTIKEITLKKVPPEHWLEITSDGFLYKMVRIIVGTLIEAGLDKLEMERIPEIIESKSRINAGFTAPARGLTLVEVYY